MTTLLANFSTYKLERKHLSTITIILLLSAIFWHYRAEASQIAALIADREALVAYLAPYGKLGAFIFFVLLSLQVFVPTIPGQAIIITGGYLYGFGLGRDEES